MLINTSETFCSADNQETDGRLADFSWFVSESGPLQGSASWDGTHGHSQLVCVALFYAAAFTVTCGPSPTGTDRRVAVGSGPSGSSMATCVSRVKGRRDSHLRTMKCFLLWVDKRTAASTLLSPKRSTSV